MNWKFWTWRKQIRDAQETIRLQKRELAEVRKEITRLTLLVNQKRNVHH